MKILLLQFDGRCAKQALDSECTHVGPRRIRRHWPSSACLCRSSAPGSGRPPCEVRLARAGRHLILSLSGSHEETIVGFHDAHDSRRTQFRDAWAPHTQSTKGNGVAVSLGHSAQHPRPSARRLANFPCWLAEGNMRALAAW